ncbi:MAG TPA: DUF3482 domain-containing protein [Steroidobacter sp.]|uniref:DUF3482 domain-containing protein n=1 Tax=Steroidobacter sp. TaxID=1978227 RepID=UPI002EDB03D4
MSTHPTFAIVGHPNKGKSSIVSMLAEDETVAVSPDPGTTRQARGFQMQADGRVLYELVDTPGFQRPRALLEWLQAHERSASERPAVVREFVTSHEGDPRFKDECELLRPILAGAGILYVVDGAHPYGAEYEAEMEILRWTGQPRMALINLIGPGDYVEEWRRALNQYFSIVRVFDALRADFGKRLELLRAFRELSELDQSWARSLEQAVEILQRDRKARQERAAAEIADLLIEVLSASESAPCPEGADQVQLGKELTERLRARIRRREHSARRVVQELYRHRSLRMQSAEFDLLAEDLFSERSFSMFGLSNAQLSMTGAATGALAGGALDAAVGGASLLLGAGVGAIVGGLGAMFGSNRLAKVRLLGAPLGGHRLIVGPISATNLPWVILGRSLLHHRLVAETNHARRESLVLDASASEHLAGTIDAGRRRQMESLFRQIREQSGLTPQQRDELVSHIVAAMDDARQRPS